MTDLDFTPTPEAAAGQRQLVLSELMQGPRTTLQLRALGIASPAARVLELRRGGWTITASRAGRFARYSLHVLGTAGRVVAVAVVLSTPALLVDVIQTAAGALA